MANEYAEAITSYLTAESIHDFHFDYRRGKHPAVVIQHNGRTHRIVFPLTGSDWRGPANTISTIRHVLGLFQTKTATTGARRVRRHSTAARRARHVSRARIIEPATPQPDKFLGPLLILKARLEEAARAAEPVETTEAPPPVSATKPTRIALRTPWLGRRTRYATM